MKQFFSKTLATGTTEQHRNNDTLLVVFLRTSGSSSFSKKPLLPIKVSVVPGCSVVPVVFRCSGSQCFTTCYRKQILHCLPCVPSK